MSNIRTGTISGVNGTDPVTLTKQSAAKVYCTYDCNPSSVLDSYNVSSLTDNGTGTHTVSMTSAFSGIYYSPATHGKNSVTTKGCTVSGTSTSTKTASALQLLGAHGSALVSQDFNEINVSMHGDLA